MESFEYIFFLVQIGLIFFCYFIIISIFGNIFLNRILMKKHKNKPKSFLERLFISFGIGITIYISYCYFLNKFKLFNFFTAYLSLIILDFIYIIFYVSKNKIKLNNWFNKQSFRVFFLKKNNILSFCIIIFIIFSFFGVYWNITTESIGLLRRDTYYWLYEISYLLKNGFLNPDFIGPYYPSGYSFSSAGALLISSNFINNYFFIKMNSFYILILYIFISLIILNKIFKKKILLNLFGLILLINSFYFISRILYNTSSSFASILILIIFLILISNYPDYLIGFILPGIFFIHSLSFFFILLVVFPYFLINIINNIKTRTKFLKQMYSIFLIISLFIIIIFPYLINYSFDDLLHIFEIYYDRVGLINIKLVRNKYILFTFPLDFFKFFLTEDFLAYFDNIFKYSIGIFFNASIMSLFLYVPKRSKSKLSNNNIIIFKLSILIVLSLFLFSYFFNWEFFGLYRLLETFALAIIIMVLISIDWILKVAKIITTHLFSLFNNNFNLKKKKILKLFRLESIIIILLSVNIFLFKGINPVYYYYYYDELIEIGFYLNNNANPDSRIMRPYFEFTGFDSILYGKEIYYYNLSEISSIQEFMEELSNKNIDYLIFKNFNTFDNFPDNWYNNSNINTEISIETIENFENRSKLVKITDLSDKNSNAVLRDNNLQSQIYGTIEWWIWRDASEGNNINFIFRNQNWIKNIVISINSLGISYLSNGTSQTLNYNFTNQKWHHFRVDFECNNNNYYNLGEQRFHLYINRIKIGNNFAMIDSNTKSINYFEFNTAGATNLTFYIDAVGNSWSNDYQVGDNLYYSINFSNFKNFDRILDYNSYKLYKIS